MGAKIPDHILIIEDKNMKLSKEQFEMLKPFEETLAKFSFTPSKQSYLSRPTKERLLNIYEAVTGSRSCGGCSGLDWVKRLSLWYSEAKETYKVSKKPAANPVSKTAKKVKK